MRRHLLGLWHFLKAVLSQFYFVFGAGLLPPLYQWLSVRVPDFPAFEARWMTAYYLALFVIATFRAWLVEREAKEECQRKLDNPVDYEVSLTPERVNYDVLKKVQAVTDDDRKYATDLIAQWDEQERTYPPQVMADPKKCTTIPSREQAVAHLKALDDYSKKLAEFESKIQHCYLLDSFIKNTGHVFDEKIIVRVSSADDEEGKKFRLYASIEEVCPIPEKPVIQPTPGFRSVARFAKKMGWGVRDKPPSKDIWTCHWIHSGFISVDLAELPAGAGIGLTYGKPVLQSEADVVRLKYWVTSKQTKTPVEKELVLDLKNAAPLFKGENP